VDIERLIFPTLYLEINPVEFDRHLQTLVREYCPKSTEFSLKSFGEIRLYDLYDGHYGVRIVAIQVSPTPLENWIEIRVARFLGADPYSYQQWASAWTPGKSEDGSRFSIPSADGFLCVELYRLAERLGFDATNPTQFYPLGILAQVQKECSWQSAQELCLAEGGLGEYGEIQLLGDIDKSYDAFLDAQERRREPIDHNRAERDWLRRQTTIVDTAARDDLGNPSYIQKPVKPQKPPKGSTLDIWFDYYHDCEKAGIRYTLKQVAEEVDFSPQYIRRLHILYKAERDMQQKR
jgi:hypothetical protein